MSTVSAIDSLGPVESSLYTNQANDAMGKTDFLQLLVTQLENQDPLNPQDPTEFTSQLTEFSNLEQMMSVNENLRSLQLLQMSGNNAQAIGMIGRDILYEGNTVSLTEGSSAAIHYDARMSASDVTVSIRDAAGEVVRTLHVDAVAAGTGSVSWDGLDSEGNALPAGTYEFSINGYDASGNPLALTPLAVGRATGVVFGEDATYLDIGGKQVGLNEIYSVYQPTT